MASRRTTTDDDPGNPSVDFHGEKRSNADPPEHDRSRGRGCMKKGKGKEAKLSFMGHALMENRQRAAGRLPDHRSHRHGRAGRGAGADRRRPGPLLPAEDAGRRQELRHQGLRARRCASGRSPRTWPRTTPTGGVRSTGGPPATRATRSVSGSGSGSKRSSAG